MPRLSRLSLALALAILAVLALASCGGSDAKLLPGETASEIKANLKQVRLLASEGECAGAQEAAENVGDQVSQLQGVDARLKQALEEGAARLDEVVAGCTPPEEEFETETFEGEEEEPEADEGSEGRSRPNGSEHSGNEGHGEAGGPGKGPEGKGPEGQGPPGQGKGRSEEAPPKGPPSSEGEGESEGSEDEAGGGTGPSGGLSPSTPVGGD